MSLRLKNGADYTGKLLQAKDQKLQLQIQGAQVTIAVSDLSPETLLYLKKRSLDSDSGADHFRLAVFALRCAKGRLAYQHFRQAAKLDKTFATKYEHYRRQCVALLINAVKPLIDQGDQLLKTHQLDQAMARYQKAVTVFPEYPVPYARICVVYFKKREYRQALEYNAKALQRDPKFLHARIDRGVILMFTQDYDGAYSELTKLYREYPDNKLVQRYYKIVSKAKQGPGWRTTYRHQTRHYDVRSNVSQKLVDKMAKQLERIYLQYSRLFRVAKRQKQSFRYQVLIFKNHREFSRYAYGVTLNPFAAKAGGLYHSQLRQLLLISNTRLKAVLYHEAFHQFLDYFASEFPFWFNEGLAQYFETAYLTDNTFKYGKVHRAKLAKVRQLLLNRRAGTFAALRALTPRVFQKNAATAYPLSWSWIYFFLHYNNGQYHPILNRFFLAFLKCKKCSTSLAKEFRQGFRAEAGNILENIYP